MSTVIRLGCALMAMFVLVKLAALIQNTDHHLADILGFTGIGVFLAALVAEWGLSFFSRKADW